MNRVVLAVDGQQRLALLAGFRGDQFSGSDKTFFIGETYNLTGLHGFVGCLQPRHTDDGADYEVNFGMGRYANRPGRAVNHFDFFWTMFL